MPVLETAKDWIGVGTAGLLTLLWFDIKHIRKSGISREHHKSWVESHDQMCALKLNPILEDLKEIKQDVKEILKNGRQ